MSRYTRRQFVRGSLLLWPAVAACRRRPAPPGAPTEVEVPPEELRTLGLTAELLVPTELTPGASLAWAEGHLRRRLVERPADRAWYRAAAQHLIAEARRAGHGSFEAVPARQRMALLRASFPSLANDGSLDEPTREIRRVLRELMKAYFASDSLSIDDPVYSPMRAGRADLSLPATLSYDRATSMPDVFLDRQTALSLGSGVYRRAWEASGFEQQRGECKTVAAIQRPPSWAARRVPVK